MATKCFPFRVLLPLLLLSGMTIGTAPVSSATPADEKTKPSRSTTRAAADFVGTWTGTLFSKHANVAAFTMTVVLTTDSQGHLVGTSTLNSECLSDARLDATVQGSQITLAGSDNEGDTITIQGTLDATGTILKANFTLNGSASGRCETDSGTANMVKR